jgi:hypothetical protein
MWREWRPRLERIAWAEDPPSPLFARTQKMAASKNDSLTTWPLNVWAPHFTKLLRSGRANVGGSSIWRSFPINQMPHEGSFYPVHIMRAFVDCAIGRSVFRKGLHANDKPGDCECCRMYAEAGVTNSSAPAKYPAKGKTLGKEASLSILGSKAKSTYREPDADGSCGFVELLLPTFVWQHFSHLVASSSPPLVLRFWGALKHATNLSAGVQLRLPPPPGTSDGREALQQETRVKVSNLESMILFMREDHGFQHLFGFKAPRHAYLHIESSLSRVKGGTPKLLDGRP